MATLVTRITDLTTRIATEIKAVKASITALGTPAAINDGTTATGSTWSSSKINTEVAAQVAAVVGASTPAALNTLDELAAALGDDANFAASTASALGNRVRFDAAQTLTAPQKAQAKTNIDAYGAVEIGNPDTDFVATFNTGLL